MSAGSQCKECGAAIPAGSPAGLCAQCLLGLGLDRAQGIPDQAGRETSEDRAAEPLVQSTASEASAQIHHGINLTVGASPLTERPGDQIGPYKLLQQIGEGGFGVVYMAQQREPMKRRVALKIIKLGMDTKQVVARFEAERQALALMDHPNIAKVLDGGATDTGRPYFVMELVHGIKITEYCDQNNLPTRERLNLFVQTCRAIQHAHQKGVIHRDIKPSNILVTLHDGVPVPKIIDFGIAKATQQELTEQTVFTEFGQFLGTPAYMSPEQAEMSGLDVDTRSDIYSLGVLLYELLVGKTPFDPKELLQVGLEQMRRTIREKDPLRPSTRLGSLVGEELTTAAKRRGTEARKLISLLRGDLDWIVMKCLEKDRTRRYETANAVASDIQRHLNNEPVVARPPSALYEFQKTVRRHKFGFAAAAAVMATLSFGIVASTWEALRARRAEHEQGRLLQEAEQAKRSATERLWDSYLAEAQARRHSGQAGQRFAGLVALSNAAAIRPSLKLRNEAIACMTLADIRLLEGRGKSFKQRLEFANVDATLERYCVGGPDGAVSIRRVLGDAELMHLPQIGGGVRPWAFFTPNAKLLAVSYADKKVRLWDLGSSKLYWEFPDCAFTIGPDCRFMAAVLSNDVALYDLASRKKLKTFIPDRPVSDPGPFHPDGKLLAAYGLEHTNILVLDTATGNTIVSLPHPNPVYTMVWHPEGTYLATGCSDNLIYVWDSMTGQQIRTLEGHRNTPIALDFSHDGKLLVSGGYDGRTLLWDFGTGRQLVNMPRTGGSLAFSPDDRTLLARGLELEKLDFFEVEPGREARTIHERGRVPGAPTGMAFLSANGRLLAYDTIDGVTLMDLQARREVGALKPQEGLAVWGFDAKDRNVLGVDAQHRVFRWPVEESITSGEVKAGAVIHLAAHPIGDFGWLSANGEVCAVMADYRCQVFRTDTFTEQALTDVQPGMRFAALTPDGNLIATGAFHAHGVNVWDAHSGKLVKALPTKDDITTVAFSPDGRWLVTGNTEYRFWEVGTWLPGLHILQSGVGFAPMMAFSPDGTILAGSYALTVVRLFDAATGQILADLEPPNPWQVTCLSFSRDGCQLAACEGLSALHLWDLRAIREQLARMGLDWGLPPYPPKSSSTAEKR